MKSWIITIASILVICLLLCFLSYAEFGSFNFVRVGLALTNAMGGEGVYQIAALPEGAWLVGTRGGLDAFRVYLEGEGYVLRMDEQMGAQIPVEKDGRWDYVHWSANGMYHKFTWKTAGDPARPRGTEQGDPVRLYTPGDIAGSAYFYPEEALDITVVPEPELRFRYPDSEVLRSSEHRRLYWEGSLENGFPMEEGFCVKSEDAAAFLEDSLEKLGLTAEEREDLIIHLLPPMERGGWNLISFHAYSALDVSPAPDTAIGVLLLWMPLQEPVQIPPQTLTAPARTGFTLVQWACGKVG